MSKTRYRINNILPFEQAPMIRPRRTKYGVHYDTKTAFSVGQVIPYDWKEVLPGDTWSVKDTFVMRGTSTFLKPVMDDLFIDLYHFFVPNRLLMEHWQEFIAGGGEPNEWTEEQDWQLPFIDVNQVTPQSIADFLGIPPGMPIGGEVCILVFRAFAKVWNDYFRDENLQHSVYIHTTDTAHVSEKPNGNPWSPSNYTGMPPKANKFKDYFTSCLPSPQKGEPINIVPSNELEVVASQSGFHNLGGTLGFGNENAEFAPDSYYSLMLANFDEFGDGYGYGQPVEITGGASNINTTNLIVNGEQLGFTVSDLRLAFALQRIAERASRCGSRYFEYVMSAYGEKVPDASLQRAQFVGGKRMPLTQVQVAQTSQGTSESPLGALSSYSHTSGDGTAYFHATEHGFFMSIAVIRYRHTYQQGLDKGFLRSERFEFFDPALSFVSEQPVWARQIYADSDPDEVFGYQSAWQEYRTYQNRITGGMRSASGFSLDLYHFGDNYSNQPTLSEQFVQENADFVDRTLAVPSTSMPNFIFDIYRHGWKISAVPVDSVPGLIDHN